MSSRQSSVVGRQSEGLRPLPEGWGWKAVKDCGTVVTGTTPSKKDSANYGDYMPFVKPPELKNSSVFSAEDNLSENGAKSARVLPPGSILVSCIGNLGKTGINRVPVAFNQQINAIIFAKEIMPEFGFYYFQSSEFRELLEGVSSATTVTIVNKSKFESLPFPLPPLPEQERIVARLEELLSDLEAGVAALARVRAGVKRYKASVLKAACEGKLLESRGAESSESGLPEGWRWATVEELADGSKYALKAGPFGSSLKKEYYVPKGYKIYGQEQVIRGDPYFGDYYIDEDRYQQLKSNAVKPGDILISLVGTIGKVLILPENIEPGIINPRLVKLSLERNLIDSRYFKFYMETETARHYFSTVSHGETMEILNLGILKSLPVPLPPLEEQRRIVAEVERRLESARAVESAVEVGLKRARRLRQAVLRSAFEGRL